MPDLDAIRRRHQPINVNVDCGHAIFDHPEACPVQVAETICECCAQPWPCDVDQLANELDRTTAEGVDAAAERLVNETGIRSMQIRNGQLDLDLEPARELVAIWVSAARTMLSDAPNYSETRIDLPPTDADPKVSMEVKLAGELERYAFTLQRVGALTPHEARVRAEQERDELLQEAMRQRNQLLTTVSQHWGCLKPACSLGHDIRRIAGAQAVTR